MGLTTKAITQIENEVERLSRTQFRREQYHLLNNNCRKFADALLSYLTGERFLASGSSSCVIS